MSDMQLNIPLTQLLSVLSLVCLCLLMGRHKLGLLTGYLACFYWGYLANMQALIPPLGGNASSQIVYLVGGLLLSLGGVYLLMQPDK